MKNNYSFFLVPRTPVYQKASQKLYSGVLVKVWSRYGQGRTALQVVDIIHMVKVVKVVKVIFTISRTRARARTRGKSFCKTFYVFIKIPLTTLTI